MKKVITHYVGSDGSTYSKDEYSNHGKGGIHKFKKDLPAHLYPYTFLYKLVAIRFD